MYDANISPTNNKIFISDENILFKQIIIINLIPTKNNYNAKIRFAQEKNIQY